MFFLFFIFASDMPFKQELSKYLRGYHNCTKLDMTDLGGLLFRALVDSDRTRFDEVPKLLGDLVPADQIKIMTTDDWKTVKGRQRQDKDAENTPHWLKINHFYCAFYNSFFYVFPSPCSTSSTPTASRVDSQCRKPKPPSWKPLQHGQLSAAPSLT